MDESAFYGVILLGFTVVMLYSILKDAAVKSAQKMCPLAKPEPPRPAATAPSAQPLPAPAPLMHWPGQTVMPIMPPAPAHQPPQVMPPAFPGGNGRSIDPGKVAQVIAIMDELERRRQWQPNTNY